MVKIAASIMCADLCHLLDDVRALERNSIDILHFDIMDGIFVQNFSLGFPTAEALREKTNLPFSFHLMIKDPHRYIERSVKAGADIISFHIEASPTPFQTIRAIKDFGKKAGIALNAATPPWAVEYLLEEIDVLLVMTVEAGFAGQKLIPATLRKIARLQKLIQEANLSLPIEVDGAVDEKTIPNLVRAGATILVGGSSGLFRKDRTIEESLRIMRRAIAIEEVRRAG